MNDAHRFETLFVREQQVLFDHTLHVARRNRVQIEHIGYLDFDRFGKWIVRVQVIHTATRDNRFDTLPTDL